MSKLSLLHLPGEIRNQIYTDYFYAYTKPITSFNNGNKNEQWFLHHMSLWDPSHPFCIDDDVGKLFKASHNLYLTCKQVAAEARTLFYEKDFERIGFATRKISVLSAILRVVPCEALSRLNGMLGFIMLAYTAEGNSAGVALSVLEMLAVDFGYINSQDMKNENRSQRETSGMNSTLYHVLSKRWSSGAQCWMDFDVEDDGGWFHEMYIHGSIGRLECLRPLEVKLRKESMFGWMLPWNPTDSRT
jgi:hypothetical protein